MTKTGSKSVQFYFRDNRERLASLGCLYPRIGLFRHVQLGMFIKTDEDLVASYAWQRQNAESDPAAFRRDFRRKLTQQIEQSGLSRMVLSDESLYEKSDDQALQRLRRLIDEVATSLRLVVYLRRQDDHLISRYQQRIKNATDIRRLAEFARQDASIPYDYEARLRTWERLLEPDEFVVRRFEKDSFVGGNLVQDFLDAVGVDMRVDDSERIPQSNKSLDAESVEFLRLFNLYRIERAGLTPSTARELVEKYPDQQPVKIDNRKLIVRLRAASTGPVLTLPSHVLDDFMAQWEGSNRAVAQRYLGDAGGELFRMPRRTDTTTEQRLDPARLDHYLALLEIPRRMHGPLRRLVEREADPTVAPQRRIRPRSRIRSMAIAGTARLRGRGSSRPSPRADA